jgi:hypothetical protein
MNIKNIPYRRWKMRPMEFIKEKGNNYEVRFAWIDKSTAGKIEQEECVIIINLQLMVAHTFVHEWLHDKYPKMSEKKIQDKTKRYINRMKVSDIELLADTLIGLFWKNGEKQKNKIKRKNN